MGAENIRTFALVHALQDVVPFTEPEVRDVCVRVLLADCRRVGFHRDRGVPQLQQNPSGGLKLVR